MGRISHDRTLHFDYWPLFIEHWRGLSPEFKQLCEDIGKPYGYSGMNVFYSFFLQFWAHEFSEIPHLVYAHSP